ncbi:unnamed protein product [Umbelopsis sp. WA50703]
MSNPTNRTHKPRVSSPLAGGDQLSESGTKTTKAIKPRGGASRHSAKKRNTNGEASVRNKGKAPQPAPTIPSAKQKAIRESAEKRYIAQNTSFKWQEKLFSERTVDKNTMIEAAKYLQPNGYEEVVEERNLEDWCGYPLCANTRKKVTSKYKISLSERKVFDQTELASYCSIDCLQRSKFYIGQLSDIPLWSREAATANVEVIAMDEDISQAIARSTSALNSRKESDAKLRKDYVNTLLSTLAPAPLELKIVEKDTTSMNMPNPTARTPELDGIVGAYDEIEGFRIQFKGKKVSKEEKMEPTTMVLRPQIKEKSNVASLAQPIDLADEEAIAENAMETMMMLKNMNLDEVEDSSAQLDMLIDTKQGEETLSEPEKALPTTQISKDSAIIASDEKSRPDQISKDDVVSADKTLENTTALHKSSDKNDDSQQTITIMVPSEVARKVKQAKKNKAKKEKNSNVLQMTFFGKMWTLIDRMVTRMTRAFLRNLEQKDEHRTLAIQDPDDQYYSEDYHLRKHIFSEKVMET